MVVLLLYLRNYHLLSQAYPSCFYQILCQGWEDVVTMEGEIVSENTAITGSSVDITTAIGDEDLGEIMEGRVDIWVRASDIIS